MVCPGIIENPLFMKSRSLGKWGEDYAYNKLINKGYKLIGRNYQTPFGEIDLIFQKQDCLYFIEVKTLKSSLFGLPREKVSRKKLDHLTKSILYFTEKFDYKNLNIKILIAEVINKDNDWQFELTPVEVVDDR